MYEFLDGEAYVNDSEKGRVKLANFNANITQEHQEIDGDRVTRTYVIEGKNHRGERLDPTAVSSDDFNNLAWATRAWGSRAIVFPGNNSKEHLRTAIQYLSEPEITKVYTATGWHRIDGKWTFLTTNGSVSHTKHRTDIALKIPKELHRFALPAKPSKTAWQAAAQLPTLIGDEIGFLILASAFRAPLGADFAVHITGRTGTFKSELAAICQSFFGVVEARNLPASWSSTANSIEALAYRAKDAVMVLDDFVPTGTSTQQKSYQTAADRIMRAVGNQAGRARLTETSSMQETMFPRSLILSTGEDTPEGHSVRGRMMITELSPGDITPGNLTAAQKIKPALNETMSAFLAWIAQDLDNARGNIESLVTDWRDQHLSVGHTRTPTSLAKLISGLWLFSEFTKDHGATESWADEMFDAGQSVLVDVANRQQQYLQSADPAAQYVQALRGIFSGLAAHAKSKQGGIPTNALSLGWTQVGTEDYKPHGQRIAWEDQQDKILYVDAQAGYDALRRFQRNAITLTRPTLYKRLREAGYLKMTDTTRQRNTVRATLDGAVRTVLAIDLDIITKGDLDDG